MHCSETSLIFDENLKDFSEPCAIVGLPSRITTEEMRLVAEDDPNTDLYLSRATCFDSEVILSKTPNTYYFETSEGVIPSELVAYLELTSNHISAITICNDRYNSWERTHNFLQKFNPDIFSRPFKVYSKNEDGTLTNYHYI